LDFENQSSYSVVVRVTDSGGLTHDETITVSVNDLNESPTAVAISNNNVDENTDTSSGFTVGTLTATDSDSPESFSYSIIGGTDASSFSIAATDQLILTDGVLDFENQSSYSVVVRVTDSGGLTHDETITVSVNDLIESPTAIAISNDNVDENTDTSTGQTIGTLTASDDDSPETFAYSIVGGTDASSFSIAATDQLVLSDGILDFESQPSYTVIVRVTDSSGLTHDETITVSVNDLNESPTAVAISNSNVDENTDTSSGFTVGTLTASDDDSPESFAYSIVGGADASSFSIAATDQLTLTDGVLDFENQSSYSVVVRVTDSGGLTHDETINVSVNDLNESPTRISPQITNIPTGTDTTGGLSVASLVTDDPDGSETFSYSIQPGGDGALFSIGGLGADELVFDDGVLNAFAKGSYSVIVRVVDSGGNSHTEAMTINVTTVGAAPTDISPDTFSIDENTNTTGGYVLGQLTASDPDVADTFTWLIQPGDDGALFSIGGVHGDELMIDDGVLDFESQSTYLVKVLVVDSGSNTYEETLTVNVNDVNETPQISLANPVLSVDEDADLTTSVKVADIVTVDDALGTNHLTLTGHDADKFEIVGGSELHIKAGTEIDHESQSMLNVVVVVDDPTIGLSLDDSEAFSLVVADVNESPDAVNDSFSTSVSTELSPTTGVLANDSDPEGGALSITILVAPLSGTLSVSADGTFTYVPDAGFIGTDTFVYATSDGATAASSATVEINVLALTDPTQITGQESDDAATITADDTSSSSEPTLLGIAALPSPTTSEASANSEPSRRGFSIVDTAVAVADSVVRTDAIQTSTRSLRLEIRENARDVVEEAIQVVVNVPYSPSNAAINVFNTLKDEVADENLFSQTVVGTTMFATASISVGYVIWLVRGGVLLSSVLSSLPAWQMVDPLPVIGYLDEDEDGEEKDRDDSLESLVMASNSESELELAY
ncbi:MAG: cadherin domain-containing protein, partial [Planctomycetota bacterium]